MRDTFHSLLSSHLFVHLTHVSFKNLSVKMELSASILKCTLGEPRHHANWRILSSVCWLLSWPDALAKASGNSCFSLFFPPLLHIISSSTEGETVETVTDFIFGGLQIIADGDCSHESKRCLLLRRKDMTNLGSMLKTETSLYLQRSIIIKAMVFSVVMCGCESWTIKKAECWRIDAFEVWFWRRLLRVPWTARRSNQSILN